MKTTTKKSMRCLLVAMVAAMALFSLGSYRIVGAQHGNYSVAGAQQGDNGVVGAQQGDNDEKSQASTDTAVGAESHGKKIEGTWRVQVTQRDCNTGAELRTFPALLAFAEGGTLTGATTAFPAALRGSDQGIWTHEGGRRYRAVSEAFLFNPAGAWTLRQRITQAIRLDRGGDIFTSDAGVEFFDTFGNLTSTGCATALATRME